MTKLFPTAVRASGQSFAYSNFGRCLGAVVFTLVACSRSTFPLVRRSASSHCLDSRRRPPLQRCYLRPAALICISGKRPWHQGTRQPEFPVTNSSYWLRSNCIRNRRSGDAGCLLFNSECRPGKGCRERRRSTLNQLQPRDCNYRRRDRRDCLNCQPIRSARPERKLTIITTDLGPGLAVGMSYPK
jgi:hypothetical protein